MTITINESNLADRTELGLARTLMHEAKHADLNQHLLDIFNRGITFDNITRQEIEDLLATNRFPELLTPLKLTV